MKGGCCTVRYGKMVLCGCLEEKTFKYFLSPKAQKHICDFCACRGFVRRSQFPRGLRRGPAVARLLGLLVRIPSGSWMSVSRECCVLSGRGLCVGVIRRPEESYRVWCVWVWSWSLEKWGGLGRSWVVAFRVYGLSRYIITTLGDNCVSFLRC
jgi:hypothetical protein